MSDFSLPQLKACAIGGCASQDAQKVCPLCPQWTPSRGSKYHNCNLWHRTRFVCALKRSACQGCEHHIVGSDLGIGRPNNSGIDWNDPEQVREYNMLAKRRSRQSKAVTK